MANFRAIWPRPPRPDEQLIVAKRFVVMKMEQNKRDRETGINRGVIMMKRKGMKRKRKGKS